MKKTIAFCCFIIIVGTTIASIEKPALTKPVPNAFEIMIPIGKTGKLLSLKELSTINRTALETITGKKMGFFERVAFNRAQKRLHKGIRPDGSISDKRLSGFFEKKHKGNTEGFHGLGFILGFFIGAIGVVLAYVINNDEDKKNRVKWAWIGFGASFVLSIGLYVLLILSWSRY